MLFRAILPILLVTGVSVIGSTVQAQTVNDCLVWSQAENRCLQAAPGLPRTQPLSVGELSATVAALERDVARLQDLLAACHATPPLPPAPTTTDVTAQFVSAAAAIQQRQIDAETRRAQQEQAQRREDAAVGIRLLSMAPTETNTVFVRYGWVASVSNASDRLHGVDVIVQFLDSRGLVVDTDRVYGLTVPPHSETTVRGDALIRQPGARTVVTASAAARRR